MFGAALAEAVDDAARRQLVREILKAYQPPLENILTQYMGVPVTMRRVESIRISHAVRTYGVCYLSRRDDSCCRMAFSRHLFFAGNEKNLVDVICHEMLHAALPYHEGHGQYFLFFMEKINFHLGLGIALHSPASAIGNIDALHRYRVTCGGCGQTFYYLRGGALVRHPEQYSCTLCGARKFFVDKLR